MKIFFVMVFSVVDLVAFIVTSLVFLLIVNRITRGKIRGC